MNATICQHPKRWRNQRMPRLPTNASLPEAGNPTKLTHRSHANAGDIQTKLSITLMLSE